MSGVGSNTIASYFERALSRSLSRTTHMQSSEHEAGMLITPIRKEQQKEQAARATRTTMKQIQIQEN